MNAKEIAQRAVIIVLWLIAIFAMVYLLTGCMASMAERDKISQGGFTVEADCDENEVKVDFGLSRQRQQKSVEVTK